MTMQEDFVAPNDSRVRRSIAILVTGNGVSRIGDFVYLVALNLYVLDATHSAFAVAAIWIVPLIAQLLIGGWVGSVTDRLPARTTLIVVEMLRAVIVFSLPLVPILWIYPLLFLLGSGSTVFGRSFLPYRTRLILPEHRKSVNSLMSLFQSGAILLGPAIAGALMQLGSVTYAFWLDAASFAVSSLSFVLLPSLPQNTLSSRQAENVRMGNRTWAALRVDWRDALRFLGQNWLFTALFIATSIGQVFGQAADSQEVVYAEQALHLGRFGYGMMVVAAGVGYLLGSLVLASLSNHFSTRWLIASGGIMCGIGYFIYALSQGFFQAVVGLIILGLFGSAGGIGFGTYTQHAMPVDQMGRINNVLDPPLQSLTLIMMIMASLVTRYYGVRVLMIAMTCVMIVVGIFTTLVVLQRRHRAALEAVQ